MVLINYDNSFPPSGALPESKQLRDNFTVLANAASLHALEQSSPNLTVYVQSGLYYVDGTQVLQFGGGSSPTLDVSTGGVATQQRYALLTIDNLYVMSWVYGPWVTPPIIPPYPAVPSNVVPICLVLVTYAMSAITSNLITDVRPLVNLGGGAGSGATGVQGITGLQGSQGATGQAGGNGSTGLSGSTGPQGITGLQGATGVGTQGTTGIGTQGITGLRGATGLPGPQGLTGFQGLTGLQGQTGLGATGLQGSQGVTGPNGPTGPVGGGSTGLQGVTGADGSQGVTGTAGGSTGLQGPTGLQGITGTSLAVHTWQSATAISGGVTADFTNNDSLRWNLTGNLWILGVTGTQGTRGIVEIKASDGGTTGILGVTGVLGGNVIGDNTLPTYLTPGNASGGTGIGTLGFLINSDGNYALIADKQVI